MDSRVIAQVDGTYHVLNLQRQRVGSIRHNPDGWEWCLENNSISGTLPTSESAISAIRRLTSFGTEV